MTLKAAVVTFPGSNCDQDMHRAVQLMQWDLVKLWHGNALEEPVDLILIPGGFSYGDYLRCGALARFSPAMASVHEHARQGGGILGVCNGFQILCEAGLLPGALTRNAGLKFRCIWTHLRVEENSAPLAAGLQQGATIRIPIAHGEGNYQCHAEDLVRLREKGQIVFRYATPEGKVNEASNPNGSMDNIAGITDEAGRILGMMPHPERAMEDILGGTEGRRVFESIEMALARAGA